MPDLLKRLGERIRTLRKRRGWTQAVMAEKIGIDRSFLADVERGKRNISSVNKSSSRVAVSAVCGEGTEVSGCAFGVVSLRESGFASHLSNNLLIAAFCGLLRQSRDLQKLLVPLRQRGIMLLRPPTLVRLCCSFSFLRQNGLRGKSIFKSHQNAIVQPVLLSALRAFCCPSIRGHRETVSATTSNCDGASPRFWTPSIGQARKLWQPRSSRKRSFLATG